MSDQVPNEGAAEFDFSRIRMRGLPIVGSVQIGVVEIPNLVTISLIRGGDDNVAVPGAPAPPYMLSDGVDTTVLTFTIAIPGSYHVLAYYDMQDLTMDVTVLARIYNGGALMAIDGKTTVVSSVITETGGSLIACQTDMYGGEVITLKILQSSGVPVWLAGATLNVMRLGDSTP